MCESLITATQHAALLVAHLNILQNEFTRVGAAHAELVHLLSGREARHALLKDERGDAVLAGGGARLQHKHPVPHDHDQSARHAVYTKGGSY